MELFLSFIGDWLWSGHIFVKAASSLTFGTLCLIGISKLLGNELDYADYHAATPDLTGTAYDYNNKPKQTIVQRAKNALKSKDRTEKPPRAIFFSVEGDKKEVVEGDFEPQFMKTEDLRNWVKRNRDDNARNCYLYRDELLEDAAKIMKSGNIDPKTGQKRKIEEN